MNIIASNQNLTMSSLDFLNEFINPARLQAGQSLHKNSAFIRKVEDEIDDLGAVKIIDRFNNDVRTYQLTHDQMLLVGMRESKAVRKIVLKKLNEMEQKQTPKIPTNFAEALQLAADQAKALELAAPKVAFVDNLVDRTALMNASQVAQKHKKSAIWLNKILTELKVYNKAVKRGKVFQQWFIDKGYGEMKQSEEGYSQAMFTNAGEVWVNEQLHSEGIV
ncbi:hypothetical protein VPHK24_0090 [Vibrio phage K24]|nr:DNA-binding protein [Vibrio phage 14E30.1]